MCTSFVLYSDKTYIGMNFDISERPIALTYEGNAQFRVLQKEGEVFFPAFGINDEGAFMNLLQVEPTPAGEYRRARDTVHIMRVFEDVLNGQLTAETLETLLQEKTIVNVPDRSVHSLVVLPERNACVIEPGRSSIRLDAKNQKMLVLTNFPLSDFASSNYRQVKGAGAERYLASLEMLEKKQNIFDVDLGFEVLAAAAQPDGDYPTQLSLLAIPDEGCIYFSISRNYEKRLKFSFSDQLIQMEKGYNRQLSRLLGWKGISLTELSKW